ncbi:hypothetical protein [Streptomyces sp. NPDC056796]|uniref:hypothetical protein n=1 Tax=Streptomyces sp. NPDC056796 TaxID=3345947 RepID=UPI0036B84BB6
MSQNVDQFLLRRPQYSRAHVEEFAPLFEGVVPFCGDCKDWHYPSEPHSED